MNPYSLSKRTEETVHVTFKSTGNGKVIVNVDVDVLGLSVIVNSSTRSCKMKFGLPNLETIDITQLASPELVLDTSSKLIQNNRFIEEVKTTSPKDSMSPTFSYSDPKKSNYLKPSNQILSDLITSSVNSDTDVKANSDIENPYEEISWLRNRIQELIAINSNYNSIKNNQTQPIVLEHTPLGNKKVKPGDLCFRCGDRGHFSKTFLSPAESSVAVVVERGILEQTVQHALIITPTVNSAV